MENHYHHFRKTVEREIKDLDKDRKFMIINYMDFLDEQIKVKDDLINRLENRKISRSEYMVKIGLDLTSFAFGGSWVAAYQDKKLLEAPIILVTILYCIVLWFKYNYMESSHG